MALPVGLHADLGDMGSVGQQGAVDAVYSACDVRLAPVLAARTSPLPRGRFRVVASAPSGAPSWGTIKVLDRATILASQAAGPLLST